MKKPLLSLLLSLSLASLVAAGPLSRDAVPGPLGPWVDWTLLGHEAERCPFFQGEGDRRECAWPARLNLDLAERSGRFSQEWLAFVDLWVELPGDAAAWPLDVRLDGKPAAVITRGGLPQVRLPRGRHTVSGNFAWDAPPPILAVPGKTGLLRLTLRGREVMFPARDEKGRVWLEKKAGGAVEENRIEITVLRHLLDEVPLILTTRIDLAVSGESHEELLGRALPEGFVPLAITGGLPARLEPEGRLRVQVRPGRFTLILSARHDGPAATMTVPPPQGPWDDQEVWVFEARPDLRLASVEGVPGIDPQQTTLPEEWKRLPAYLVKAGDRIALVEKRRGDADPGPDQLSLQRSWWLDFDGKGGTVHDVLTGTMSRGWRLEMQRPAILGRVAIDGQDQFITRLGASGGAGVEVRQGALNLEADSRYAEKMSDLPAVGWAEDFREVSGTLHLGPGWRLFHAGGVDEASPTWIASWSLLDLFLVLILTLSAARLGGWVTGLLALAALGLSWIEPGAPRWSWIAVVACSALVRVFPEGKFRTGLRLVQGLAGLALILVAVPFLIRQVRTAIYPALEQPIYAWGGPPTPITVPVSRAPIPPSPPPPPPAEQGGEEKGEARVDEAREADVTALGKMEAAAGGFVSVRTSSLPVYAKQLDYSNLLHHDPRTVVQTGPGVPDWSWREVMLRWRGPVERGQRLRLFLLGPGANAVLSFLRAGLLLGLALVLFRPWVKEWPGLALAAKRAVLLPLLLFLFPGTARADFPSPDLLEALRQRLLENPDCHPECASSPRLGLEASPSALRLRIEILAGADTAVPLPGGGAEWPERVMLDGAPAPGLLRDSGGRLWLSLGAGSHQVQLDGRLPPRDTFEIPLPLRPRQVTARTAGWRLLGLSPGGRPEETLQMVRERESARAGRVLDPGSLSPFVRVERELNLGLRWQVRTRVVRLSPPGTAVVLEVPLLPGESVTTADLRIKDGTAFVSLSPGAADAAWESSLAETPEVTLRAPQSVAWTEIWRVAVGATWHAEASGIPVVHRPGPEPARLREWRPWPGETVKLQISRPDGVTGRTLTIDRSELVLSPGLRSTDATLEISFRSSRGGQHTITLPEGSVLQSVSIHEVAQPIRLEGRRLTLPVAPGSQNATIVWREPGGIGSLFRAPAVDLGEPGVNCRLSLTMPASRWILLVGGPRLGPAVLFWGVLVVGLILSLLLGRSRLTPLRAHHWFLLSLGLTQTPVPVAVLVVGWLFALAARKARGGATRALWFDLAQVALGGMTVAALVGLFWAIQQGLLGIPEMQIAGNGSSATSLHWYQDRTAGALPRPWAYSWPLSIYRLAMLLWSLWLAAALLGWLRWGWECFSEGGVWRKLRTARPGPPPLAPASPGS